MLFRRRRTGRTRDVVSEVKRAQTTSRRRRASERPRENDGLIVPDEMSPNKSVSSESRRQPVVSQYGFNAYVVHTSKTREPFVRVHNAAERTSRLRTVHVRLGVLVFHSFGSASRPFRRPPQPASRNRSESNACTRIARTTDPVSDTSQMERMTSEQISNVENRNVVFRRTGRLSRMRKLRQRYLERITRVMSDDTKSVDTLRTVTP